MMKNRGIFLISSPFQALNVIEAIDFYELLHAKVIVTRTKNRDSNKGVFEILEGNDRVEIVILNVNNYFSALVYFTRTQLERNSLKKFYTHVFNGDYFDPVKYLLMHNYVGKEVSLVYLDDGNSTYEAVKYGRKLLGLHNRKAQVKFTVAAVLANCKSFRSTEYFTVFLKEADARIVVNDYNTLRRLNAGIRKTGCHIIIGSPVYGKNKNLTSAEYLERIDSALEALSSDYALNRILYFPHRAENIEILKSKLLMKGLEIFDASSCIEMELVRSEFRPINIISFGSSASISLLRLFPSANSAVLTQEFVKGYEAIVWSVIYDEYKKCGVKIISKS